MPQQVRIAPTALERAIGRVRLARYKRRGLQIADDCELNGIPDFGSEPYLISIGKHVRMSGKVTFITHDGATWVFRHRPEYQGAIKFGRIVVNDNCFIGLGAIILPGVSIGPDAVVAAGAVVTSDVPPDSVVAGNPARVIMSVSEYAERTRERCPAYDVEAYETNRERELVRLFPRPW